jgi:hypothetical protein
MKKYFLYFLIAVFVLPISANCSSILESENTSGFINTSNSMAYRDSIQWNKKKTAPWFVDRFKISAGFFSATTTTDIAIGNNSGALGSRIDFEKDLGLKKM